MRIRKQDYLLIGFAVVLLLIVGVITITAFQQGARSTQAPIPTLAPPPTLAPNVKPAIAYDGPAQAKLLDRILNREQLEAGDTTAKQKLLATLPQGQNSGTLYNSQNVQIDYVHGPDLFQADILTVNIAEAKAEANIWFRSQGVSQEGICKLPLMFYLNWNVVNILKDSQIVFSPLPNGC